MRTLGILIAFLAFLNSAYGASKLEATIFNDEDTLAWFARKDCKVGVEIKITPFGGGGPDISSQEELDSKHIPNTLNEFYALFPNLREMINGVYAHKDDYYLMISEILSEPGCKEKVSSFIVAYVREIK